MKIEIISGSPRHESVTVRVAKFLEKYLNETTSHNINLLDVRDFPLTNVQNGLDFTRSGSRRMEKLK